jgi:ferredoxin
VAVIEPDACKPGCPACARICPRGAILFPLYEEDEAIRGAPGQYPAPDAEARRMYYARTGALCPACEARKARGSPPGGPAVCPECGTRLAQESEPSPLTRELNALLDELDARLRRS